MLISAILAIENESDRQFIERLYEQNYGIMLYRAKGILKNHARAEDAVQAVLLRLIDRIDLLRACNVSSVKSYLLTCVRNEAVGQLRREGKRYAGDAEEYLRTLPDDGEPVDASILYREQVQALVRALKSLPERDYLALRMKYYERMDDAQIGALLGIQADTVRSMLSRARKRVLQLLKKEGAQ